MSHFKTKRGQTYWYRIYHFKCSECGTERIVKKRERFSPKPKSIEEQHIYIDSYDYCKDDIKK